MNEVDLIPTRKSLLSRLRDPENEDSWRVFFDTYGKLIYGAAVRAGLTSSEAQDVVQDTVLCVAKKIPEFKYDPEAGSFKGWLLQLTRWRIVDQFRKRKSLETSLAREERMAEAEKAGDQNDVLESYWEQEWERYILDAALDRVRKKVDPKHFQIFDEYVLKERPVLEVRNRLRVSATQVYLIKHRVGNLVKKELEELKKEKYL